MIVYSPPKMRPIFTLLNGKWYRQDMIISSDGRSIQGSGFFVSEDKVINLTELVGVVCYAVKCAQGFKVYDFSSSHLCPRQLALIKEHLYAITDKWAAGRQ